MPIDYLGDSWEDIADEWNEGTGGIPPWIAEAFADQGFDPIEMQEHDIRIISSSDDESRWIEVDGVEITEHLPFDDDADIWSFYDWYAFIWDEPPDVESDQIYG